MSFIGKIAGSTMLIGIALTPAFAETSSQPAPRENPDDKVVCKSSARTGTRFTTKVCHTVGQWDKIAEENRRSFSEMNGPTIETRRGN